MTAPLNFRINAPQVYHDGWRGKDRTCRYHGQCVVCGVRTYGFDDGENDPRGVLGRHSPSSLEAADYEMTGPDVTACFECMNDEPRYLRALAIAKARWK